MTMSASGKTPTTVADEMICGRLTRQWPYAVVLIGVLFSAHPAFPQNLPAGPAREQRAPGGSVSVIILKAETLRKDGKNSEALGVIKQAIGLDSDCGKCFSVLSGIEGNLQQFKEGEGDGAAGVLLSKTRARKLPPRIIEASISVGWGVTVRPLMRTSCRSASTPPVRWDTSVRARRTITSGSGIPRRLRSGRR